jgi:hypothetical protein
MVRDPDYMNVQFPWPLDLYSTEHFIDIVQTESELRFAPADMSTQSRN